MSYSPNWTHQDNAGHVAAGEPIRAVDVSELGTAINRRLRVMFDPAAQADPTLAWPITIAAAAGQPAASGPIISARQAFDTALLPTDSSFASDSGWQQLSTICQWLFPAAGASENAIIVRDAKPPGDGETGFFAHINGQAQWTDPVIAQTPVATVHVNELRDAAAMLSRGRYLFRAGDGGFAKASKPLPTGMWYPPAVARDTTGEMHSWFGGRQWLWPSDGAGGNFGPLGQQLVVRVATMRLLSQGADAKIALYHCLRNVNGDNFSWTHWDVSAGLAWGSPGGTGAGDAEHLADLNLINNTWSSLDLTGLAVEMFAGLAEPTFMIAPNEDTGWPSEPTHILVEWTIDFDLACPPV
jgi:hypothetical protein